MPELFQLVEAILGLIAGNESGINGADRRANNPIGLDSGLMQRLLDADLISAESPTSLKNKNDLSVFILPKLIHRVFD